MTSLDRFSKFGSFFRNRITFLTEDIFIQGFRYRKEVKRQMLSLCDRKINWKIIFHIMREPLIILLITKTNKKLISEAT